MKLAPGAMLGKTYRVVRWIGGGGMGDVYEVTHERLAGRYAAKVLSGDFASHPDAFTRFKREAMVTSGLRHPGIVQVIDFDRADEGHPYLVMELLEGQELAAIIQQSAPLGLARTLGLVEQIGSALEAAHRQGIVHRDLKPQNVFVLPLDRGRELVKILDFGISKAQVATQKLTRTAAVIGTPQYMAPEQAIGRGGEVDARADQFALAAITYELLSGQPAFAGDSVVALIYQVIHVDPPPLAAGATRLPAAVDATIRRGLAKQADARYRDVGEFIAALFAAADNQAAAHTGSSERTAETSKAPATSAAPVGGTKKLSTTLSASAAQAHAAPRQSRRIVTTFLLVAAATSVAGTAIWIRGTRSSDEGGGLGGAAARPSATSGAPLTKPRPPREATLPLPAEPSPPPTAPSAATAAPPGGAAVPPDDDPARSTPEQAKQARRRKRPPVKTGPTRGATENPHRDEMVHDL